VQFPAQWIAGGSAVALLSCAGVLTWRLFRLLNAQLDRDRNLHIANTRCEHRLSILVQVAQEHGWQIPAEFWADEERSSHDDSHAP